MNTVRKFYSTLIMMKNRLFNMFPEDVLEGLMICKTNFNFLDSE